MGTPIDLNDRLTREVFSIYMMWLENHSGEKMQLTDFAASTIESRVEPTMWKPGTATFVADSRDDGGPATLCVMYDAGEWEQGKPYCDVLAIMQHFEGAVMIYGGAYPEEMNSPMRIVEAANMIRDIEPHVEVLKGLMMDDLGGDPGNDIGDCADTIELICACCDNRRWNILLQRHVNNVVFPPSTSADIREETVKRLFDSISDAMSCDRMIMPFDIATLRNHTA